MINILQIGYIEIIFNICLNNFNIYERLKLASKLKKTKKFYIDLNICFFFFIIYLKN